MAFTPIPEYEGKSPYVFISYAQQDEKTAYAVAVKMYNEGFRLWGSAACGNPSTVRIAERLSNSAVVMVFLSKSYLKTASYRDFEARAVMNCPTPKIVICLDDTPLGTDWNTVDFPAGIRYNPDVPEGLWLRINSSDALERCRGAWPRRPMPEPFEEKPKPVDMNVDEEELTDEMRNLNGVMSSFGAGLDEDEIENISLFRRREEPQDFRWPQHHEPSQEQEYYSIENLIDNSPMPVSPEKQQYDSMIGLIESFMERSGRAKEEELRRERDAEAGTPAPPARPTYREYRAVPKNEFDSVDMAKDSSSAPVVITESSAPVPITVDYGEESGIAPYSMTRNSGRAERVSGIVRHPAPVSRPEPDDAPPQTPPAPKEPPRPAPERPADNGELRFEKIVDDRQFIKSTEDTMEDAKLTYHLGSLFEGFDESDFIQDEQPPEPEPPKPEPPKPEPPKPGLPDSFFEDDAIGLPTLKFDRPARPEPDYDPPKEDVRPHLPPTSDLRNLSRLRRRYIVSVRRGIRHIEYDEEMYAVNGRWIPGHIYHRLMPNAHYTAIRRINRTTKQPEQPQPRNNPPASSPLGTDSRLHGAVNTFFTPRQRGSQPSESIPDDVRSVLREKHEIRRSEAIRQFEENQAAAQPSAPQKTQPTENGEAAPARKHKFSHEGGIKKSLMANMESPVKTDAEESHRQHGARAEAAAQQSAEPSEEKKSKKKDDKAAKKAAKKAAEKAAQKKAESKKGEKKGKDKKPAEEASSPDAPQTAAAAFADVDEDSLLEMPRRNLPNLSYDPSAYSSMNLSEILFGEAKDDKKSSKKKKKK